MNINALEKLKESLRMDEGIVTSVYLDHLGYKTFGIGHLITNADPEHKLNVGAKVPIKRVEEVFEKDLSIVLADCKILYPEFETYPEEIQIVLGNMCFNMGRKKLSKFVKMNNFIRLRDWKGMTREMKNSLWAKQVPNRANRLINRVKNIG